MSVETYWVYILHCNNDSYYTGYTNNLIKRYHSHVYGTGGCKYTRSFKPLSLAQCWPVPGEKAIAMKVERYIKKLTRMEKEELINQPTILQPFLLALSPFHPE
jgi:putative endonuclease